MKSIFSGLILVLALFSSSAFAQGISVDSVDNKVMSQLTTGAYFGPYYKGNETKPLIVIQDDNKYYKIDDYTGINTDWILSTNILKGKEAADIFGESSENGVIIFTLKKDDKAARKYFRTIKKNKLKV